MAELLNEIFQKASQFHLNILFILGLAIFGGTIGGRLFQKLRIPKVVGYIIIGILLGRCGLNIINPEMLRVLQPFNYFALGLIGFMIGGELKKDIFKKYGKQFIVILLFEGLTAFVLVTVLVGFIGTLFFKNPAFAWSLGLLLGAIAAATAPAATTDVLWEIKAKGPLTSTVFGIVALDDALAITLFAIASTFVSRIIGLTHKKILFVLLQPLYEIGGAILLGGLLGNILVFVIKRYEEKDRILAFLVGMVLFVLGISIATGVSMLLAAMTLGMVVVNGLPNMSRQVFNLLEGFTPPIYILFFVFVGAKFNLESISFISGALILTYLLGRTLGKMSGAYLGSFLSGAPKTVKNYLPLCLFSQAGVAIGLSIVAAHLLPENIGNLVIIIITVSTFVVQLIGPSCVKWAAEHAKEDGKNITEEDLTKEIQVKDIVDDNYPLIQESMTLNKIIDIFYQTPYTQYPVIDPQKHIKGVINIDSIKQALEYNDIGSLALAADVMRQFPHSLPEKTTLFEVKKYIDKFRLGFLPITNEKNEIIGCLDRRIYNNFMLQKITELQNE